MSNRVKLDDVMAYEYLDNYSDSELASTEPKVTRSAVTLGHAPSTKQIASADSGSADSGVSRRSPKVIQPLSKPSKPIAAIIDKPEAHEGPLSDASTAEPQPSTFFDPISGKQVPFEASSTTASPAAEVVVKPSPDTARGELIEPISIDWRTYLEELRVFNKSWWLSQDQSIGVFGHRASKLIILSLLLTIVVLSW